MCHSCPWQFAILYLNFQDDVLHHLHVIVSTEPFCIEILVKSHSVQYEFFSNSSIFPLRYCIFLGIVTIGQSTCQRECKRLCTFGNSGALSIKVEYVWLNSLRQQALGWHLYVSEFHH